MSEQPTTTTTTTNETENESKVYTLEEVSKHNSREDCWTIINGNVYDVTKFLDDHPGGADDLINVAGRDGTNEFLDVGHSNDAVEMLKDFFIGTCPEKAKKNKPLFQQPTPTPTPTPTTTSTNTPSSSNKSKSNNDWVLPTVVSAGVALVAVTAAAVIFGKMKK
eukprot:gene9673-11858_t